MTVFGESIIGDLALQREFFTAISRLRESGAPSGVQKSSFITAALAFPLNLSPQHRGQFEQHIKLKDSKTTTHVEEGDKVLHVSLYPGLDTARWLLEQRDKDGNESVSLQISVGNRVQLASAIYTGPEGYLDINETGRIIGARGDLAPYKRGYADVGKLISGVACLSVPLDVPGALTPPG